LIERKTANLFEVLGVVGGLSRVVFVIAGFVVSYFSNQNYIQLVAHKMYIWIKPKSHETPEE
jgi:hypothetical protein